MWNYSQNNDQWSKFIKTQVLTNNNQSKKILFQIHQKLLSSDKCEKWSDMNHQMIYNRQYSHPAIKQSNIYKPGMIMNMHNYNTNMNESHAILSINGK